MSEQKDMADMVEELLARVQKLEKEMVRLNKLLKVIEDRLFPS